MLFDEEAGKILPPSAVASQVTVMSELLQACEPTRKTDLGGLIRSLTDRVKRRGLLVIVSDFFTDLDAVYDGLNRLRFLGHEVLLFQVLDGDELELPFDGPTVFKDIEGDEELYAEPNGFRKAYQKAMLDFLEELKKECGARGYDHIRLRTDDPLGASLGKFLRSREEAARGGGRV